VIKYLLRINADLYEQLRDICNEEERSFNWLVNNVLKGFVEKYNNK
jgi:hypothetical protein